MSQCTGIDDGCHDCSERWIKWADPWSRVSHPKRPGESRLISRRHALTQEQQQRRGRRAHARTCRQLRGGETGDPRSRPSRKPTSTRTPRDREIGPRFRSAEPGHPDGRPAGHLVVCAALLWVSIVDFLWWGADQMRTRCQPQRSFVHLHTARRKEMPQGPGHGGCQAIGTGE